MELAYQQVSSIYFPHHSVMKYEKEEYIELFKQADLNGDKAISLNELLAFLKKNKMDPDIDRAKRFWPIYDKNHDGKLQLPEWIELMEAIFYENIQ